MRGSSRKDTAGNHNGSTLSIEGRYDRDNESYRTYL